MFSLWFLQNKEKRREKEKNLIKVFYVYTVAYTLSHTLIISLDLHK